MSIKRKVECALTAILLFGVFMLSGCLQQKTIDLCVAMPPSNDRNLCFRDVAKAQNDTSICARIDDEVLRDYWCYREIAFDTKNSSICEKITNVDAKESCYAVLNGSQRFERGVRP
ncbi:MAG: hypothetical protein QW112_02200 [Candidatus Micrarchaeia archaeon]